MSHEIYLYLLLALYIELYSIFLFTGKDKKRVITYAEFSQFLHDFHDEYAQVAFKAKDNDGSGFISSKDFFDIMVNIKSHLLTEPVKANLVSACQNQQVSYPFFVAFISLLSNIELIKKIYLNATNGSRTLEVTKGTHLGFFQSVSLNFDFFRGISALCTNDVTNHTLGGGYPFCSL